MSCKHCGRPVTSNKSDALTCTGCGAPLLKVPQYSGSQNVAIGYNAGLSATCSLGSLTGCGIANLPLKASLKGV